MAWRVLRSGPPLALNAGRHACLSLRTCRQVSTSRSPLLSGHSKWSKIRHDKAAADKKKNTARSHFAKLLTLNSKLYGADPQLNASLAAAISGAKKNRVPKALIDAAIARGQGRSLDGKALETMIYEILIPPGVAFIIDFETDNRLRVLKDMNFIVKKHNGSPGSSKFLLSRRGRVVFERRSDGEGVDDIIEEAIEAGAEDIEEDDDDNIVMWAQPNLNAQLYTAMQSKFNLKVLSSEIVWMPNEDTKVELDNSSSAEFKNIIDLLDAVAEFPDVQGVWSNIVRGPSISDEDWAQVEQHLSAS